MTDAEQSAESFQLDAEFIKKPSRGPHDHDRKYKCLRVSFRGLKVFEPGEYYTRKAVIAGGLGLNIQVYS